MMKKRVYLIPGFGDSPSASTYTRVRRYFRKENIFCKLVKIDWKYNSIENYVSQILLQYKSKENVANYLFGFSFGALLAVLVTPLINPRKLYLCSISPFFKEDIVNSAEFIQSIGKKRWLVLKKISFNRFAEEIACKTIIIVGDKELASVTKRAKAAQKLIRRSQLFIAKGAAHNLLDKGYDETLQRVVHKNR